MKTTSSNSQSLRWLGPVAVAVVCFIFAAVYSSARSSTLFLGALFLYFGAMAFAERSHPAPKDGTRLDRWTFVGGSPGNAALKGLFSGVFLGAALGLVTESVSTAVLAVVVLTLLLPPVFMLAFRRWQGRTE